MAPRVRSSDLAMTGGVMALGSYRQGDVMLQLSERVPASLRVPSASMPRRFNRLQKVEIDALKLLC